MLLFVICFYGLLIFSRANVERPLTIKTHGPIWKTSAHFTKKQLEEKEEVFRKNLVARAPVYGAVTLAFLFVVTAGIALNVYFLTRKAKGLAPIPVSERHSSVPWELKDVFQVFVFLFFIEAVILLAEGFAARLFGLKILEKDFYLMVNSLFRDVLVAFFVVFLVVKKFKRPLSDIGLTARNFFRNVATGLVGYLALIPYLLVLLFILAWFAQTFSYEPPPQTVVEIYMRESHQKVLVFFTLFVAVLGPIIEEIFFRGFAYKAFRVRWGVRGALMGSALIFSALHMNLIAFLPIFVLGILLAYLYEKTGSLVPSMAVHVTHNLLMVIFTLGFKSLSG